MFDPVRVLRDLLWGLALALLIVGLAWGSLLPPVDFGGP